MEEEKLVTNLREFVTGWREVANKDGKDSLLEVNVGLAHVLFDFCQMAEIPTEEIGLTEGSRL